MSLFRTTRWSRREVLKQSSMLSVASAVAAVSPSAAEVPTQTGPHTLTKKGDATHNLFTEIGVRPIINGHGTFTIISGSRSLPEVKQAMYDASFYFVHLDEMMDGIGAELGRLNGCEWGITTTGCEAAICLATIACSVGTNIEKVQALPYKMDKNQVLIPKHSRNPYDIGVRMTGAELVEFESPEELQQKLNDKVAMIYILAGPQSYHGPMGIKSICDIANAQNVPVFVDAAAEEPQNPNMHIQAGASLVGYSGGKCMRGPQSSGMMIGKKALCKAAYFNAAPHHCYGRALKCSKEEAMGLLAAVRQWYKRDHESEQRTWMGWMQQIANKLKGLPSLDYKITPAGEDLSNRAPTLQVHWDANVLKITGSELVAKLDAGTPRIQLDGGAGARPDQMQSSFRIMSYMLEEFEIPILANAIYDSLTKPGHYENPIVPSGTPTSVQGQWAVSIKYPYGEGKQQLTLQQSDSKLTGEQKGEIYTANLTGEIHANQITLHSRMPVSGNSIVWTFRGEVSNSSMAGTVNMGEYGDATWRAMKV